MSDFIGGDAIIERLTKLAAAFPHAVERGLYEEALVETKESMRRTPVDTGALRASHVTRQPVSNGRDISVAIEVGGSTTPYALIVHENLEADHPVGQAKFLESTLLESAPHMAARVAKRVGLASLL